MGKRTKQPTANLDDFLGQPKDDVKKGVDSLLRSRPETASPEPGVSYASGPASPGSPVSIIGLDALGLTGPQAVFRMHEDALVLRIEIRTDTSLTTSETHFDANFQLLEYATNAVAKDSWWRGLTLQGGTAFSLSQGNNQGPDASDYTPPGAWGLKPGLYVFRALIEIPALNVICQSNRSVLFRVR